MQATESGRLKDEATANRRLGRLAAAELALRKLSEIERFRGNDRCGGRRPEEVEEPSEAVTSAADHVATHEHGQSGRCLSEGCYLLRSNLNETDREHAVEAITSS